MHCAASTIRVGAVQARSSTYALLALQILRPAMQRRSSLLQGQPLAEAWWAAAELLECPSMAQTCGGPAASWPAAAQSAEIQQSDSALISSAAAAAAAAWLVHVRQSG